MNQFKLCLDVGGTYIKGATFPKTSDQDHYAIQYFEAKSAQDQETILSNFKALLSELADAIEVDGVTISEVAMAFPGPFDYVRGIPLIRGLNKYGAIYGVDLRDELATRLAGDKRFTHAMFRFVNDAVAFAVGENQLSKARSGAYFTIGTGFGSTSLENSQCVAGKYGIPEDGMIYAVPMAESIIDDHLSARGIEQLATHYFIEPLSVKELADQARQGVLDAKEVFMQFGEMLTTGVAPFIDAMSPDEICFGGQISKSADLFLDTLKRRYEGKSAIRVSDDTSYSVLLGLDALEQAKG